MPDAPEVASPEAPSAGSAVPAQLDCRAAHLREFFTSREQSRRRSPGLVNIAVAAPVADTWMRGGWGWGWMTLIRRFAEGELNVEDDRARREALAGRSEPLVRA